jgi:hypothetical protein
VALGAVALEANQFIPQNAESMVMLYDYFVYVFPHVHNANSTKNIFMLNKYIIKYDNH